MKLVFIGGSLAPAAVVLSLFALAMGRSALQRRRVQTKGDVVHKGVWKGKRFYVVWVDEKHAEGDTYDYYALEIPAQDGIVGTHTSHPFESKQAAIDAAHGRLTELGAGGG